jgi:hypothetical protein
MDDLSDINILIGTPCYGGLVHESYMRSLINLVQVLNSRKIKHTIYTIGNESLITRARNSIVAKLIGTPQFTHLLFIDSDITFDPESIIRFLLKRKPVVGGCYPKKNINWDKVKENINKYKDINNDTLMAKSLEYAVNIFAESNDGNYNAQVIDGWIKVSNIATGFLLIERTVFDILIEKYPDSKYVNDVEGYMSKETDDNFYSFFDTMVHPTSKRYLSEDYAFSQKWLDSGGEIWLDLTCSLTHTGTFHFKGNILSYIEELIVQNT